MNNVTPFRQDTPGHMDRELTEVQALAPASGAPRPLTVRPVRSPEPEDYFAPVIRLQPRTPSKPADQATDRSPGGPVAEEARGTDAQELRQVTATARSVAQAAMEAIGGTRPVQQLARWLDPVCFEKVARRASLVRERQDRRNAAGQPALRLHRSATIRSSRVCQVSDSAYEASLVIAEASRVRAVALRLEFRRGLWKVAALEIG